jgi:chromate reductase, NAD(P)H dehydrogenase (quinone)
MLLVINATNRPGNKTNIVSQYCFQYLSSNYAHEVKFLSMEEISGSHYDINMYDKIADKETPLTKIQDELIIPSKGWLVISPEYNGSYPGIFKTFIDALSVRKYKETFAGRFVGLIGTSSGRAGNLRGMEHLTSFLNYLKITVFHNKLPISTIEKVLVDGNELNEETKVALNAYMDEFMVWSKGM